MKADKILQYANDMHRMVMLLAEHDNQLKDYGNGQFATTMEAHFILTIHEHPGIMMTELARYWGRTKGMVSCIVGKLETRGLIEKRKTPTSVLVVLGAGALALCYPLIRKVFKH